MALFIAGTMVIFLPRVFFSSSDVVEFKIEKGQSLGEIARLLAKDNLIISRVVFMVYARATGQERKFQAGRYLISRSSNIWGLVNMFSHGLAISDDISVVIPEGTNVADIDKIFSKTGLTRVGDLLAVGALQKEGYLFPDTYKFNTEDKPTAVEIIKVLEDNFNKKNEKLIRSIAGDRFKKAIIVASILEKEVKTEYDMRLVAGIIEKRLSLRMPLQVDAVVAYGVCYPKFELKKYCDVSLANIVDNLNLSSGYNIYRKTGLPPAPISNPGSKAIRASLNPQRSDYLYYLTAKNGVTIFSKTSAEHQRNRKIYLNLY